MNTTTADIQLIRFDWAIKTILRDKANFEILEGFLTALLKENITIEQILDSESNMEENLKFNRVDLLVHDSKGLKIIVEVQNDRETYYLERMNPEERRRYENYIKSIVIERDVMETARQEGEHKASLRIAQSLLDVITDDELLAKKTGLTVAEVLKLREQITGD